jgi:dolichol-phosphate mannosyltransferase
MSPETLSLVVPVFNERESLPALLDEIAAAVTPLGVRAEVVFVDDGSTDDSWKVIRELVSREAEPSVRVRAVRFRRNFGKAAALAAGFARCTGSVAFTLDADLQDDPAEIPRFLAALDGGLDVVSGWKKVRHDPWHKVFPSRVFNRMISALTGVRLHDHNCGFKAYRAEVLREVTLYGEFHRFVPVLAAAQGFRVGELVIHHRPRKFGHSKFGARRFLKGFLDLLTVRLLTGFGRRPAHYLGTVALLAGGLGCLGLFAAVALILARWATPWTGADLVLELGLMIGSFAVLLFGTQTYLAGLLAEFVLARTAGGDPPYRIAESLDPPAG